MTKSPFPQRQQTPMFALRSCIADRANTVNRTEFENLKLVVEDAKTKCDTVVKKTNEVIQQANDLADRTNLFAVVFDGMYTFVYPTHTIYYSAKPPEKFMKYQSWAGNFGYFSGNWGFTEKPVTELEFTWFDPTDKNLEGDDAPTFEQLMQRELCPNSNQVETQSNSAQAEAQSNDAQTHKDSGEGDIDIPVVTTPGGGLKHKYKIPIYAYWCQKEEEIPENTIPDERPPDIKPVT